MFRCCLLVVLRMIDSGSEMTLARDIDSKKGSAWVSSLHFNSH